ncbi:coproporphyrinogen III oxidase-like Fe-S oxidoreductase [Bacillus fengqiuensis]|nr:coproporphyrinogen III oxidase-like Fe-S oxidoreductase [Bacillus fengqiuensis]
MEKILLIIGIMESKAESWYPSIDFVLAMIVLSCSIYFLEILPGVLRKEKMIKDEKDI